MRSVNGLLERWQWFQWVKSKENTFLRANPFNSVRLVTITNQIESKQLTSIEHE